MDDVVAGLAAACDVLRVKNLLQLVDVVIVFDHVEGSWAVRVSCTIVLPKR